MCLRRDEKYLNLPKPLYEDTVVELQDEERLVYNEILKKCARGIDNLVSSKEKVKKYRILFAATMKLRRLCNHGTLSGSDEVPQSVMFQSSANGEPDCEFCGGNDEDRLALLSSIEYCTECGRSLSRLSWESKLMSPISGSGKSTPSWADDPGTFRTASQSSRSPACMPQGVSTKLLAVLQNLEKCPAGSKRYGDLSR